MDVGLSRPAGRGVLFVRRTSCPSRACRTSVALGRATLNNQAPGAYEGRDNLCTTKHTKSTKVSENEAMDVSFQSSCFSCPSWSLELSSVVDAQSGEYACQLYRVLRGGRRTRCPSYMGRTNVDLSRPAGRGVLLVRRTSCPSRALRTRRLGSSHAQQPRSRGGRRSRQSAYHEAHEEHEGIRE